MTFCALTTSTTLSETFVNIGRTEQNININIQKSACKVPVIIVVK